MFLIFLSIVILIYHLFGSPLVFLVLSCRLYCHLNCLCSCFFFADFFYILFLLFSPTNYSSLFVLILCALLHFLHLFFLLLRFLSVSSLQSISPISFFVLSSPGPHPIYLTFPPPFSYPSSPLLFSFSFSSTAPSALIFASYFPPVRLLRRFPSAKRSLISRVKGRQAVINSLSAGK